MTGPVSEARKNFEAYLDGTQPVTDTMRKVARAFLLLAVALAKMTDLQITKVDSVASEMARIHKYMKLLNSQIALVGPNAKGDTTLVYLIEHATQADAEAFKNTMLAVAGMTPDPRYKVNKDAAGKYYWPVLLDQANAMVKNLQVKIDDLSSDSQKEQLALQNLMGRYNSAIEATTAGTQKSGTQAQAVLRAMGSP